MQDAGGGGGAGNAGPQERKLIQAFSANLETLDASVSSWSGGAAMLQNVARRLGQQADQLETTFGKDNPTGMAAAQRYREVQAKVTKRESEMRTASQALAHTRAGLVAAQDDYGKLPPVTTNPDAPQTDLERLMDPGGTLKKAAYDSERQQREAAASAALARLDTHFEKSAEDLRTVAGDRPTDRSSGGGGGETGGGSTPLGHRTSSATISGVPTGTGGGDPRHPGPTDGGGDPGPRDPGPRDPGPTTGGPDYPGTTTGGNPGGGLAGGGGNYEPAAGTSGGYTGGSTATPTSGSGTAAASAVGAGAVSGAGAIAASRGGVSGVRPVAAPGTSAGAIGRSSTTASRGAIGRSGSMMPGQGNAARTGSAGRAGSAGARGAMAPGQGQNAKSAGRSGGRSGSGGRGGRGDVAPGQGGRKKDEKDLAQEHLAFADEESWLDDEGATDSVID